MLYLGEPCLSFAGNLRVFPMAVLRESVWNSATIAGRKGGRAGIFIAEAGAQSDFRDRFFSDMSEVAPRIWTVFRSF